MGLRLLGVHLCVLAAVFSWAEAYYFLALGPTNFCTREVAVKHTEGTCTSLVFVHVNKLDSAQNLVPYEYGSFDFCEVSEESPDEDPLENLGQVVLGERLRASPYNVSFRENIIDPRIVCSKTYTSDSSSQKKLQFLRDRIHEEYMQQWVIDNMPVTRCYTILDSEEPYCTTQFPVGCYVTDEGQAHDACFISEKLRGKGETYIIFNAVKLTLHFHRGTEPEYTDGRLVRAQVRLDSCKDVSCFDPMIIDSPSLREQFKDKEFTLTVPYMYTVDFVEAEDIKWASRSDYILHPGRHTENNHDLFDSYSGLIVGSLTVMVIVGILRLLYPDRIVCRKKTRECVGWKLVHGDVFRPPQCAMLLSACAGSGAQLLVVAFVCLVLACLGFLSPPNRESLLTAALVLYAFTGCVAGYVSGRLYKMMGGLGWKSGAIMTALFVPGVCFTVFFILNLLFWRAGSSAAIPYTTLLALLCLWFGVSLPLTFFGAFFGFRKAFIGQPVHSKQILREIHHWICRRLPCQGFLKWLTRPLPSSLLWGAMAFGYAWVHVYLVFDGIWVGEMYYLFGASVAYFCVLVLVCAEVSIVCCYSHLDVEYCRWWWRPFLCTGASAFYLLLYSLYYLVYKTSIAGGLSYLIFFGYTFIMVFLFWIVSGTIGFGACLLSVSKLLLVKTDSVK